MDRRKREREREVIDLMFHSPQKLSLFFPAVTSSLKDKTLISERWRRGQNERDCVHDGDEYGHREEENEQRRRHEEMNSGWKGG